MGSIERTAGVVESLTHGVKTLDVLKGRRRHFPLTEEWIVASGFAEDPLTGEYSFVTHVVFPLNGDCLEYTVFMLGTNLPNGATDMQVTNVLCGEQINDPTRSWYGRVRWQESQNPSEVSP